MNKNSIKGVIWKEGKYFVAQCLNFDVSSFGNTKKSALKNLKEAVGLYLEGFPKMRIPLIKYTELIDTAL